MATTKTIQINGIEYEEHRVELNGRYARMVLPNKHVEPYSNPQFIKPILIKI